MNCWKTECSSQIKSLNSSKSHSPRTYYYTSPVQAVFRPIILINQQPMNITLYAISDSDKHFSSACDEYTKRLWKSLTIHDLKPTKHGTQEQIITSETQTITNRLKPNYPIIILNPEWTQRTSKQRKKALWWKNTQLVIGGPYGLDYTQFPNATHISLGSQTMPHGLAKLVLLEQCYRVQCIWHWKKYHY